MPPGDFSVPMSPASLLWLAERLDREPATYDALLVTIGDGAGAPPWLHEPTISSIRASTRASRYRDDRERLDRRRRGGVVIVGRGLCGRWEVGYEVAPEHARRAGSGAGSSPRRAGSSRRASRCGRRSRRATRRRCARRSPPGSCRSRAEVLFTRRSASVGRAMTDSRAHRTARRRSRAAAPQPAADEPAVDRAARRAARRRARRSRPMPTVKAVVVAGSEKAFAAGADITEFRDQDAARARRPTRSATRSTRSRRSRGR